MLSQVWERGRICCLHCNPIKTNYYILLPAWKWADTAVSSKLKKHRENILTTSSSFFKGRGLRLKEQAASEPPLDLHEDHCWLAVILLYLVEDTERDWTGAPGWAAPSRHGHSRCTSPGDLEHCQETHNVRFFKRNILGPGEVCAVLCYSGFTHRIQRTLNS